MRFELWTPKRGIKILLSALAVAAAWGVLLYIVWPLIRSPGYAVGVDVKGHMFTSQYIADYLKAHRTLPAINPYWYAGFEIFHNTLWLVYVPVVAIYLIVGNAPLASRVFDVLIIGTYALTMFIAIRRGGSGIPNAFLGALAFSLTPAVIGNLGSQTKALAIAFIPLVFLFVNRLLRQEGRYSALWLALLSALMFFSHPMIGLAALGSLLLYALIYALMSPEISVNRVLVVAIAFVSAGLLLSWYLIPSSFEHIGQTAASETLGPNSLSARRLFYQYGIGGSSLIFMTLAAVHVARKRKPQSISLFTVGVVGVILATGIHEPLYRLIPLPIYPYLWLVISMFAFIYLAATTVDLGEILRTTGARRLLTVALAAVLLVGISWGIYAPLSSVKQAEEGLGEYAGGGALAATASAGAEDKKVLTKLKTLPNPGRIYMTGDALVSNHLLVVEAKVPSVEGSYYTATQLGRELAWMNDAIKYRHSAYVVTRLRHLNVRYALLDASLRSVGAALRGDGFRDEEWVRAGQILSVKDEPSSYVMPVSERTLVVGRAAAGLAALRPNSIMGLDALDAYDMNTLKSFDVLVLSNFRVQDKAETETLIEKYVASGGTVVVDLQGFGQNEVEENPSFLGVTSYAQTETGDIALENSGRARDIMPQSITSPPSQKHWRFVTYHGLDQTLSKLKKGDETKAVLGYKKVGKGRILFVGLNLFHYAYLTHDQRISTAFSALVPPSRSVSPQVKFSKVDFEPENGFVRFDYRSGADLPLLVSLAYSPHWRLFVDGHEHKVTNMEDLLFTMLPSGRHRVDVRYGTTPIHYAGAAISLMTLSALGLYVYAKRKRAGQPGEYD